MWLERFCFAVKLNCLDFWVEDIKTLLSLCIYSFNFVGFRVLVYFATYVTFSIDIL